MKSYHEHTVDTSQQDEKMEKDINERAQSMRQAQHDDVEPNQESAFEGCRTDQLRTAMQEVIDTHTPGQCRKMPVTKMMYLSHTTN